MYNVSVSLRGQGWISHAFFIAILFSLSLSLKGQYLPPNFGDGDTIALDFHHGPETIGPELTLVHDYSNDGFSIQTNSPIQVDVEGSAFGVGTSLTATYSIDHDLRQITITLTRSDGQASFTDGWTCQLMGIIIVIDDVQPRLTENPPSNSITNFKLYPNPSNGMISLEIPGDETVSCELLNSMGMVVRHWELRPSSMPERLSLFGIRAGHYQIHIRGERTRLTRPLIIQ